MLGTIICMCLGYLPLSSHRFFFLLHHSSELESFSHTCFFVFPHSASALYVVDLKKFRKIAAGDRLRGQYQALSQDPNSLSNLDQVCNSEVTSSHYTFGDLSCYFILCPLIFLGPPEQHDPPGGHQVSSTGVAVVWDLVWRHLQSHSKDYRPGESQSN